MGLINFSSEDVSVIIGLYSQGLSISNISTQFKVSSKPIRRVLKENNIRIKNASEFVNFKIAQKNRKKVITWNKGLTKDDPKMREAIEKGRKTQLKNGKSAGRNNPMFGKPPTHSKIGYRKDLGHYVRSSWEANFARILKYLSIPYEYESETFLLDEGDTYTPDFYIRSKDKYYELKGFYDNDKYLRFEKKYNKKVVVIKENFYSKLIHIFSKKVPLEDRGTLVSSEEIKEKFLVFYKERDGRTTLHHFSKHSGISLKTIRRYFGKSPEFYASLKEDILALDKEKIKNKLYEFVNNFNRYPTQKELKKYYPRTGTLLKRIYNSYSISDLYYDLGIKKSNFPWTELEDTIIKNNYKNVKHISELLKAKLPNRTIGSIKNRISFFKLGNPFWSKDEVLILKNNFLESKEYLKKLFPNRTRRAITSKIQKMRLRKRRAWKAPEIDILKKCYEVEDKNSILQKLSERTWSAIQIKASLLKLKRKEF